MSDLTKDDTAVDETGLLTAGFSHIATLTADLDRLLGFYERVFDARVVFDMDEEGFRHAGIDVGGAFLHAFEMPAVASEAPRRMFERGRIDHLGLTVPTRVALLEVRRRLHAEGDGVLDGDVLDLGPLYSLSFIDPDGMSVEVNLLKPSWETEPVLAREAWTMAELEPAPA